MEASASPPVDQEPAPPSYLDRLRAFALTVEHRINPSEVQDVVSAVVNLLDHAGVEIPEPPEPAATEESSDARVAELEAEIARLRSQNPPAPSTEP